MTINCTVTSHDHDNLYLVKCVLYRCIETESLHLLNVNITIAPPLKSNNCLGINGCNNTHCTQQIYDVFQT